MPGVATNRFRIFNAEQFKESVGESANTKMYIFVAKPGAWVDETSPPTPIDTIQESRYEPWRNMLAAHRVTETDITFAVPRRNWTSGTVYQEYDSNLSSLYSLAFYVNVAQPGGTFNVYKCIYNNRGAASTVEPSGTSTSIISTSDGYSWKFMFTISAADALKFVASDFIPIKTLTADDGSVQWDVQQAASNSAIEVIDVTANGSGYAFRANTLSAVSNTTFVTLDSGSSEVDNAYTGSSLFISSGLGSGQIANVISYNGTSRSATLSAGLTITPNSSSSFHIGPRIIISGDGNVAKAYANVSSGEVTRINMITVGSGYSKVNTTISGAGGTGAKAVSRISPPGGHGSNPVSELGGHNVMLNVRIQGNEGNNFPTNNDFRIIGLLIDPLTANDIPADANAYDLTTKLTVTGINNGPYVEDEFIIGTANAAIGRVVSFANTNATGTNGILKLTDVDGTFETETITGNTSGATATATAVTAPELKSFSGDIIYRDNKLATEFTADGITDIKIVIRY